MSVEWNGLCNSADRCLGRCFTVAHYSNDSRSYAARCFWSFQSACILHPQQVRYVDDFHFEPIVFWELDSLHWFSQHRSPTPHFSGCAPRGAMTPKFELRQDFCTKLLPPIFIILSLLVWKLSCWQANKHTRKQTDAAENIQHCLLCYDVVLWTLLSSVQCLKGNTTDL